MLLLLQLIVSAALLFVRNLYPAPNILDFKPGFYAFSINYRLQQNSKLILLSSCLPIFFPLWIQSTLHFENITSLLMILVRVLPLPLTSIMVLTSFQPLVSCFDLSASRTWFKAKFCVVVVSCCAVLLDDYKLTPNGLLFGIPAVLLLGVMTALYHEQTNASRTHRLGEGRTSMPSIIILPLLSAVACYLFIESEHEVSMAWKHVPMLCLNLGATALAITLTPLMLEQTKTDTSHSIVLFSLPGLTALLSQQLGSPVYLTYVQIPAFLVSICCCAFDTRKNLDPDSLTQEDWLELPLATDSMKHLESSIDSLEDHSTGAQRRWPLAQTIFLVIATIAWLHFLSNNFSPSLPQPNAHDLRLDTAYTPASAIDIVMSIYHEPTSHITSTFSLLTSLPSIGSRSPRLILYTKDPAANLTLLKQQTNATKVLRLPNVGREGHTYLHHIISSWNDLAAQTFFLQASIHNPNEFAARVDDYYTPQTGMLSLGFSGQSCECNNCGDRFGWQDRSGIVEETWKEVFNQTCAEQRVLLSYKGQFVASAARVRANEKAMYEKLSDALQEPDSWAHGQEYLQGRPDSLNAPYLGYTLERLWSVIMQCSDERIAALCPTLLSGKRRGGSKSDCQCLDS